MNDILPPMIVLQILADPVVFITGMLAALLSLVPFAVVELWGKRRAAVGASK